MSHTTRSLFAVLDGLLLFLALEGVFYAIAFLGLNRSFDTDTVPYLLCNLIWAVVAALAAGYVAARVAQRRPVLHGVAVAVPLLLLGVYNLYKGVGNRHTVFVIAFNLLVPLAPLVGASLAGRRRSAAARIAPVARL